MRRDQVFSETLIQKLTKASLSQPLMPDNFHRPALGLLIVLD